jgi:hypothetical protein
MTPGDVTSTSDEARALTEAVDTSYKEARDYEPKGS